MVNEFVIQLDICKVYFKFNFTAKYQACLKLLKQQANVCQLDYSNVEYPDSYFADLEHLNETGQEKMTALFVKDLEKIRASKRF